MLPGAKSKSNVCPRLLDYVVVVGSRHLTSSTNGSTPLNPELLRRFPEVDHVDFRLPPEVVYFCQPEGSVTAGPARSSLGIREQSSFFFTLTDKDSGSVKYAMCLNVLRPINKAQKAPQVKVKRVERHTSSTSTSSNEQSVPGVLLSHTQSSSVSLSTPNTQAKRTHRTCKANHTRSLTSLCIVSHHPFFSSFRECLYVLHKLIVGCEERFDGRKSRRHSHPKSTVWSVLTGEDKQQSASHLVMREVNEIETWIHRLLSAPGPVPGTSAVEVSVLPPDLHRPLLFALPDHTRFPLIDFPLHLPLELMGVDACITALTCILLEFKVVFRSRDYNTLSMSILAFMAMLYPLEYMFPIIPLLPACMDASEQLLLAPTPFIIGIPAGFQNFKAGFRMPDDVWVFDIDSNKITAAHYCDVKSLPALPEPDCTALRNHLKQVLDVGLTRNAHNSTANHDQGIALASISITPEPVANFDLMPMRPTLWRKSDSIYDLTEFNPLIYGNDVDSVDVATRIALVRFLNSPNVLGHFTEHTRILRLYPRPVVAIQHNNFKRSRSVKTQFTQSLVESQAVEFFAEWALRPSNIAFLRVQTGVYDPLLIGDKPRWFSRSLNHVKFTVFDESASTLETAIIIASDIKQEVDNPTDDESGSASDGGSSTISSFSSSSEQLCDGRQKSHRTDSADTPLSPESLTLPSASLQLPDPATQSNSDSALSAPHSDDDDAASDYDDHSERARDSARPSLTDDNSNVPGQRANFRQMKDSMSESSTGALSCIAEQSESDLPSHKSMSPAAATIPSSEHVDSTKVIHKFAPLTVLVSDEPPSVSPLSVDVASQWSSGSVVGSSSSQLLHQQQQHQPQMLDDHSATAHTSLFTTLSDSFNAYAKSASGLLVEAGKLSPIPASLRSGRSLSSTGLRQSFVEKSTVWKQAASDGLESAYQRLVIDTRNLPTNTENHQFLQELVSSVLNGEGLSTWKIGRVNRLKKLMEDENYRNYVISRLNLGFDHRQPEDGSHIEDVKVNRSVFKGMVTVLKALVYGLENSYNSASISSFASVFVMLEMMHTHYYDKASTSSRGSIAQSTSRLGSMDSLASSRTDSKSKSAKMPPDTNMNNHVSMLTVHGDSDMGGATTHQQLADHVMVTSTEGPSHELSSGYGSETGDAQQQATDSKRLHVRGDLLLQHKAAGSVDTDYPPDMGVLRKKSSAVSTMTYKSTAGSGYRYFDGRLYTALPPTEGGSRVYLFELFVDKDRSSLWNNMQFWEDAFLDAVAQERDMIGMDQGPAEMMNRYESLGDSDKRRLEHDEDRLLFVMLHNTIAVMVLMGVKVTDIKRRVRRLLGKCHIGLAWSHEVNALFDQIQILKGNDIDLLPTSSRMMQKHSFTVHWGPTNAGDMLFMEVYDDCLVLRSINGIIMDRCWFEKLVNVTYHPKVKVLCLWRLQDGKTVLHKFYTKKCKELYLCIKATMEKAAGRLKDWQMAHETGGHFAAQEMSSGLEGIVHISREGVTVELPTSKMFIELKHVKKCRTQTGNIFILEHFDIQAKKLIQMKFKSAAADRMCYAILRIFSLIVLEMEQNRRRESHKPPVVIDERL